MVESIHSRICVRINNQWFVNGSSGGRLFGDDNIYMVGIDIDEFSRISYEMLLDNTQVQDGKNNRNELVESWVTLQWNIMRAHYRMNVRRDQDIFEDYIDMKYKLKWNKDCYHFGIRKDEQSLWWI